MRLRSVLAVFLMAALAFGCGGGEEPSAGPSVPASSPVGGSPSPSPSSSASSGATCSPNGTELEIVAEANTAGTHAFDRDCLAAPAAEAFTIRFDNRDADTHNVEILDQPGGTSLFSGKVINGPKVTTYSVEAMDPGTYYFRCAIHPLLMNGTFVVE